MEWTKKSLNFKIFVLLNIYSLITDFSSSFTFSYFTEKEATKASKDLRIHKLIKNLNCFQTTKSTTKTKGNSATLTPG